MIVERLHVIQDQHGFLPDAELRAFSRESGTPLARIQEVASFFPHFRQEWDKTGDGRSQSLSRHELSPSPAVRTSSTPRPGSRKSRLPAWSSRGPRASAGATGPRRAASRATSHGDDEKSFHDRVYAGLSADQLKETVAAVARGGDFPASTPDLPHPASDPSTWLIDVYRDRAHPPYEATRRFLKAHPQPIRSGRAPKLDLPPDLSEDEVAKRRKKHTDEHNKNLHPFLWQLQQSNLLGMGGAGMPVYQKWFDVWQGRGPEKYIVCKRRRERTGHLQGPRTPREDPAPGRRRRAARRVDDRRVGRVHLHPPRVSGADRRMPDRDRAGPGRTRRGLRARQPGPPDARSLREPRWLHLRRAKCPSRSDGGPPGPAAEPAPGTPDERPARQADGGQQRGDPRLGPGGRPQRRRLVLKNSVGPGARGHGSSRSAAISRPPASSRCRSARHSVNSSTSLVGYARGIR